MKVYLIRHAQSEENVLPLGQTVTPSAFNAVLRRTHTVPLTAEGQRQAHTIVAKLVGARVERLYTSPFTRAMATATAVGAGLGLAPQPLDDLREVMPRPFDEQGRAGSLGGFFISSYLGMLLPWGQGENWAAGYRRAQRVWAQLTSAPAAPTAPTAEVAAVSHLALISLLLLSLRRDQRWHILEEDVSNGGVSVVARA